MSLENNIYFSHFTWSKTVTAITVITLFVLLLITGYFFFYEKVHIAHSCLFLLLVWTVILYTFLQSPRTLSIDDANVKIKKIVGYVLIPVNCITSVEVLHEGFINRSIRTFGSGGLFGYLGFFQNKEVGKYRIYATQSDHRKLLMIKTTNRIYVVSVDDVDRCISAIESVIENNKCSLAEFPKTGGWIKNK